MIQLEGAWYGNVLQKQQWKVYWCIVYVLSVYLWCIDKGFFMHANYLNNVLSMYCQCIQDVSWMYYEGNIHVSLMYYGCIGTCTSHLCFPPYSAHHLFGAQFYQGIQFWASAAHGSGSWRVGTAMAWQHQTCFLADRAWMFQQAL